MNFASIEKCEVINGQVLSSDRPDIRAGFGRHLTFCIFDMPNLPCPIWITGAVVYLRFHGSEVAYGG